MSLSIEEKATLWCRGGLSRRELLQFQSMINLTLETDSIGDCGVTSNPRLERDPSELRFGGDSEERYLEIQTSEQIPELRCGTQIPFVHPVHKNSGTNEAATAFGERPPRRKQS